MICSGLRVCHPERRRLRRSRRILPILAQILPGGIHGFDESVLFRTRPALELLFPLDGGADVARGFIIDQFVDVISLGKTLRKSLLMLIKSALEIVRDADVHDLVVPVGQDVHKIVVHIRLLLYGGKDPSTPLRSAQDDREAG